jgi:hypothetical protein
MARMKKRLPQHFISVPCHQIGKHLRRFLEYLAALNTEQVTGSHQLSCPVFWSPSRSKEGNKGMATGGYSSSNGTCSNTVACSSLANILAIIDNYFYIWIIFYLKCTY